VQVVQRLLKCVLVEAPI